MSSDHFSPWSERQGESGFAWSFLGAALASTRLPVGVINAPVSATTRRSSPKPPRRGRSAEQVYDILSINAEPPAVSKRRDQLTMLLEEPARVDRGEVRHPTVAIEPD